LRLRRAVHLPSMSICPASDTATQPSPSRAACRRAGRAAARGFTLIEVVAAFAILALGLTLTMQIASGGMRQARQAADYTEAALLAQSLLDTAGVGERIKLGETRGEWEGGFRWTLNVAPFAGEAGATPSAAQPLLAPVELVELDLQVTWERGGKTREARYLTLRAMMPENP